LNNYIISKISYLPIVNKNMNKIILNKDRIILDMNKIILRITMINILITHINKSWLLDNSLQFAIQHRLLHEHILLILHIFHKFILIIYIMMMYFNQQFKHFTDKKCHILPSSFTYL